MAEITALVVSHETLAGARALQAMRVEHCGVGAPPLAFVVVGLIGAEDPTRRHDPSAPKLGSTALRRRASEHMSGPPAV